MGNFKASTSNLGPDVVVGGELTIKEQASAESSVSGQGQIWIKSSDNELYFTDESGNNVQLTSGGSIAAAGGTLGGLGSTDNVILRANGTGGETAQGSGVVVDDSDNVSGMGTLGCGAITSTGDMTIYDDQNNADASVKIGTSATEALTIQVLNGTSNKTCEEVVIGTSTASSTSDHGKITIKVDDASIATFQDEGLMLASSMGLGAGVIIAADGSDSITIADSTGNVTLAGDLTVSGGDISYGNGQNATLSVANTAAGTAGKSLTISAGTAATAGSNNTAGGDLVLKSGGGDGTGTSNMVLWTKSNGTDAATQKAKLWHDGTLELEDCLVAKGSHAGATLGGSVSASIVDYYSNTMRLISKGPNSSTQGKFQIICQSNDGSTASTTVLDVDATGHATFGKRVLVDDATDATTTTDGSLQTDGGLSVVKDAVFGNDIKLKSDSAVIHFGDGNDVTLTHTADTGLTIAVPAAPDDWVPSLTLLHSHAGGKGPLLDLVHESASPAANDIIGSIRFRAKNDNDDTETYAYIGSQTEAVTDGSESASMYFNCDVGGTDVTFMDFANVGGSYPGTANKVTFHRDVIMRDDIKLIFGNGSDASIEYDEDGTDQLRIVGASIFENSVTFTSGLDGNNANITNVGDIDCDSISIADAAVGLNLDFSGANTGTSVVTLRANMADALSIKDSGETYMKFITTTDSETVNLPDDVILSFGADFDTMMYYDEETSDTMYMVVGDNGLALKGSGTGDDKPIILTLQSGEEDIAANDVIGKIAFSAPDEASANGDNNLVAAAIQAVSEGDFSNTSNATKIDFMTGVSEAATTKMSLSSAGHLSLLTDGATIKFGADSDIQLYHDADAGLSIKQTTETVGEPILSLINEGNFTSGPGIHLALVDNSANDNDVAGFINFYADDAGGAQHQYGRMEVICKDTTAGGEDGMFEFSLVNAGSDTTQAARLHQDGTLELASSCVVKSVYDENTVPFGSFGAIDYNDSANQLRLISLGANSSTFGKYRISQHTSDNSSNNETLVIDENTMMTLKNQSTSGGSSGAKFRLVSNDGSAMADDDRLGSIEFAGAEDGSNNITVGARIDVICDAGWSASENGAAMLFYTTDGNASQSEVLRLDSDKLATFTGGVTSTAASNTLGATSFNDANITNVGDIDCDSISIADAANGLNLDFSGANSGTGVITLKDNVAAALTIKEGSNTYFTFVSTDDAEGLYCDAPIMMKDDQMIVFGSDQNAQIEYDEDGTDTVLYSGASLRISDDVKLEFGTGGDASIEYDENGTDQLRVALPAAGMATGNIANVIALDVDVNAAHSGDNSVIVEFGPKIPAKAIITKLVVGVKQLTNLGTCNVNIQFSATSGTAADSNISTGTELIGAGVTTFNNSNSDNDDQEFDIELGSGEPTLKKIFMLRPDNQIRVGGNDVYLYVCNAGTGNGTTNPSTVGKLSVYMEYYCID